MARIGQALRFQVLNRDGFKCHYCGRKASDGHELEIDHVKPLSDGGTNHLSNLRSACFDCNRGKRDAKILPDAIREARARSPLLHFEFYCQSDCGCREVHVYVKDYDNDVLEKISRKWPVCPMCRSSLKFHWVKTAAEQEASTEQMSRCSVAYQMYRAAKGPVVPTSVLLDDRLPPVPDGWFGDTTSKRQERA